EYVESVFIYGGKAFQMFGGSASTAKPFINMVNLYRKTLPKDVKIFCLEIPTPIDFYLPAKYKNKNNYEKPNIDLVYAALDSGVVPVHTYEELKKNADKYLFFNTDHHWTGLGGYYAYRAFCASAGFVPYELSAFEKKTKRKFLGTLYSLTHDKRLKENIDSVEYFKLPIPTTCSYYLNEKSKKAYASKLYAETASGGNSYSVFLGGDQPLIKVITPNKNGRRIMVIKDSYGNAFAPYLALHYEQVFIVDYRYFKSNIPDFIKENKITDFIFAHNTFVVNTRYSSSRETALLKSYKGPAVAEKKKIVDTLSVKKDTIK
ncbi:MAG TPA: DHHW family protein, partial [Cytophagaceae bacterium]|nr:DHHW family protein [Cytophagaceae bacterium]